MLLLWMQAGEGREAKPAAPPAVGGSGPVYGRMLCSQVPSLATLTPALAARQKLP